MTAPMSREDRVAEVHAQTEQAQAKATKRAATTDADRAAEYELKESIDALRLKYRRR